MLTETEHVRHIIDTIVTPANVNLGHTWLKRKLRAAFEGEVKETSDDVLFNLSMATLFVDSSRGVYIPQYFAQSVQRDLVTGVGDDDYTTLIAGPDHPFYWEAWADVLDNATINDPKLGECYLHQDEDLWVVPVEKAVDQTDTCVHLGITFRKMQKDDYEGYAGADEGSYIAESDKAVLIYSPTAQSISEIGHDEATDQSWQHDWNMTKIL